MQIKIEQYSNSRIFTVVVVTLSVYLSMRYLCPILSPFLFAFLLAGLINPLVRKMHNKTKIKKSILAGLILFICCTLIGILLWLLCCALFQGGGYLAGQIPDYQEDLCCILGDCCDSMERRFGINGILVENFILEQANMFVKNFELKILPAFMGKSMGYMKSILGIVSYIAIMLIAILLIMKDYDRLLTDFMQKREFRGAIEVTKKIGIYIKTFVKAQIIILVIISGICAITLGIMGMQGGIWYGMLTGFMDMLPFIGTGIMLVPLALYFFLNGQYVKVMICFCLYGACALVREFLEPKLIGNKIGVWPVGILFAVFAGVSLFGVSGIIKGPLSLVIICETCKYIWSKKKESTQ